MWGRAALLAAALLGGSWVDAPSALAGECAASPSAADLNAFFSGDDAAGLAGADYPHAYSLGDGRTLWLFQDAFMGVDRQLADDRFAHNAALLQTGECFELLPSSGGRGTSWIGSWVESELAQWFWPLDAEIGADGHLWLFLAEVRNGYRSGAAPGAEPVATWRARYTLPDLELVDMEQAADSSRLLFGYSIVSDEDWTYLYGHCYTQFVPGALDGFDPSCSPHAYLARVPRGRLDAQPMYWSGTGWTTERANRAPVLTATQSMPISVERFNDMYVAVSDEGDWFGADVVVRTARQPQGPWTEAMRYTPTTSCGDRCNNYGAFVLPHLEDGQLVVAHSNNAWDMRDSLSDASLYRVSVQAVAVPDFPPETVEAPPRSSLGLRSELRRTESPVMTEMPPPVATAPTPTLLLDPRDAPRWNDVVFMVLRLTGLVLSAAVAVAAAAGFMTSARRTRRHAPSRSRCAARDRSQYGDLDAVGDFGVDAVEVADVVGADEHVDVRA